MDTGATVRAGASAGSPRTSASTVASRSWAAAPDTPKTAIIAIVPIARLIIVPSQPLTRGDEEMRRRRARGELIGRS
ncbi:MAG: hypothetical protein SangKO_091440 [Sandaracinaceae bacterium]